MSHRCDVCQAKLKNGQGQEIHSKYVLEGFVEEVCSTCLVFLTDALNATLKGMVEWRRANMSVAMANLVARRGR